MPKLGIERARSAHRFVIVSALALASCAHAINTELDVDDGPSNGLAGAAPGSAEGGARAAAAGAGGDLGHLAPESSGGSTAGQAAGGSSGSRESAGSGGAPAGGTGNGAAGNGAAGTPPAAEGGTPGIAGAGPSGSQICHFTVDLNSYTTSKAGCGGYAACKGQLHWRNDETHPLNAVSISFSVPAGVTCTGDHSPSKWTIVADGHAAGRCTFTANNAISVEAAASFGFGYDTTQSTADAPSDVTITDPSCTH